MAKRFPKNSGNPDEPRAAPPAPAPEAWTIARLAADLGVPADKVELQMPFVCNAGEDFICVDQTVVLTASGIAKIRARFGEKSAVEPPPAVSAEPAQQALHREDLRLTRVFPWSHHNVLAETSNGIEVSVRVRSIAHLEQGMVLRECIRGEMGWTYEGRLPRTLGERQLYFPPTPRHP